MKRHRTDPVSLVFGLLFAAVAAWWLLPGQKVDVGWFVIGVLGILGAVGVVSAVLRRPQPAVVDAPSEQEEP
jgi:hypothetical protein